MKTFESITDKILIPVTADGAWHTVDLSAFIDPDAVFVTIETVLAASGGVPSESGVAPLSATDLSIFLDRFDTLEQMSKTQDVWLDAGRIQLRLDPASPLLEFYLVGQWGGPLVKRTTRADPLNPIEIGDWTPENANEYRDADFSVFIDNGIPAADVPFIESFLFMYHGEFDSWCAESRPVGSIWNPPRIINQDVNAGSVVKISDDFHAEISEPTGSTRIFPPIRVSVAYVVGYVMRGINEGLEYVGNPVPVFTDWLSQDQFSVFDPRTKVPSPNLKGIAFNLRADDQFLTDEMAAREIGSTNPQLLNEIRIGPCGTYPITIDPTDEGFELWAGSGTTFPGPRSGILGWLQPSIHCLAATPTAKPRVLATPTHCNEVTKMQSDPLCPVTLNWLGADILGLADVRDDETDPPTQLTTGVATVEIIDVETKVPLPLSPVILQQIGLTNSWQGGLEVTAANGFSLNQRVRLDYRFSAGSGVDYFSTVLAIVTPQQA